MTAQALTDEQIDEIVMANAISDYPTARGLARDVERAVLAAAAVQAPSMQAPIKDLQTALDGADYIAVCKLPEFVPAAAVASAIRSAISRLRASPGAAPTAKDPQPDTDKVHVARAVPTSVNKTALPECHGLDTPERVCFYEQDFYVLSNFSAFNVQFDGRTFQTAEHAYHWHKFFPNDAMMAYAVASASSAHQAFKLAEQWKVHRRRNWDTAKVGIMLDILRAKAAQHEYVRRKLLATGDRELVENSWRDDFWGWGPNRDGQNMLGKLWMQVRSELQASDSLSGAQKPNDGMCVSCGYGAGGGPSLCPECNPVAAPAQEPDDLQIALGVAINPRFLSAPPADALRESHK